jgi:hypothetical protein
MMVVGKELMTLETLKKLKKEPEIVPLMFA